MDLIDTPEYHVYQNKDGRTRIYNKKTHEVTSYPRYIMSDYLGRTLEPNEQVHHIDGNPLNNDIDNLVVLPRELHDFVHEKDYRKYYDIIAICDYCGKEFVWKAHSQQQYYMNSKRRKNMRGPFCSKSCAGKFGTDEQRRRKAMTECE